MDRKLSLIIQFAAADKLSGAMRKIVGLGEKGASSLARMKREARSLDKQLQDVRARLASGSMQGGLVMAERELVAAIHDTNRAIERQKKLLAIDNRVGKMQAQAQSYKSRGQENMVGGATLLAPFVLAGREAMNFSSGMVDIQQKAELSNRETRAMANNILTAARAAHQLPEAMRSSVDVLAGFGMDPRQAAKLAEPIGRVGTAFKVDLADGAAAAYANINNLKVGLRDIPKTFDIMAAGANAGAFELKDMARWFPQLTSQAKALGQTGAPAVADLTAALQIARRGAGSADQAATNVANLLQKINSPETIRKFQKNFGVDLPAALHEAYRKGKTPLEAIAEITQRATGGNMEKLGFAFEDTQAQGAIRSLIQDMDDYRKMRSQISRASGTVDRAFSQRELQDASVAWTSFKGQLSQTAIVFGTTLLPAATRFLGMLNRVLGAVGDWAQANPRLASTLLTMVAGLAAARVGLGAVQFAFGSILGPMASAWGLFQKWKLAGSIASAFPRAAKAFGILRTAALFLGRGMMRAGLMMLANPMVLIVAAIAAAIGVAAYLIYTHWDTIKAAFASGVAILGQAWSWIKEKFSAGITWLTELPSRMLSIGKAIIQGLVSGIKAAPGAVWNALKSIVMSGVNGIRSFLGIKSPSRVFMGIGGYMTEGLALGVERTARRPIAAVRDLAGEVGRTPIRAVGKIAAGAAAAGALGAAAPAAASAPRAGDTYHITIQQQPGEDGEALARRVMEMLQRAKANDRRGAYRDE